MPSLDRLTVAGLLLLGLSLCVANVWYAALRSTRPLDLSGTVTKKRVGIEKHPGNDDVYLLELDNAHTLRIDGQVFDAIPTGARLEKIAWSNSLRVDDRSVLLTWSRDFYGLLWCMTAAVAIMGAMIRLAPYPSHLSS